MEKFREISNFSSWFDNDFRALLSILSKIDVHRYFITLLLIDRGFNFGDVKILIGDYKI